MLTLLSATETETEIKSPVGSWTLSQDSVHWEREKGMFWTSLLTDCPIMSHEIFNTETEKQHTHETKRNWQLAKEKPQNNSAIWQTTPRTQTPTQTQSQTRTEVAHTHRVEKWQNANRKNGRKSNEKCIMKIRNVRAKEKKKKKKNNFSAKYYLQ